MKMGITVAVDHLGLTITMLTLQEIILRNSVVLGFGQNVCFYGMYNQIQGVEEVKGLDNLAGIVS